ncbi:MAG: hypothetical protein SNJ62_05610 [Chloracidobacterium sp.]|uniref:Uncharacterized protein n=1 Tax=Chloracidobacterium validum TaxID=2821543 RepID=A0ABX8B778_9BACT|nr:hypothetical protein [Chloracidobacterium validum]QUW02506.1 hypothetical protein J8C06_09140 [Chloracidobacterium validum]
MTEAERMRLYAKVIGTLGDRALPRLYETLVLSQRTRRFALFPAPCLRRPVVQIQYTLLGIELKVGRRRLSCPDMATARYLAVFAQLGVSAVAVPYDISQLPRVADAFETAWQQFLLATEHQVQALSPRLRNRARSHLLDTTREAIEALGAGAARPVFVQTTRQRPRSEPSRA